MIVVAQPQLFKIDSGEEFIIDLATGSPIVALRGDGKSFPLERSHYCSTAWYAFGSRHNLRSFSAREHPFEIKYRVWL
jgi:hypothetical protein